MANFVRPLGFVLLGGLAGAVATYWFASDTHALSSAEQASSDSKEPLYWVAPMDPNFKSDKPGKSPMGMDLIPVYEGGGQADDTAGTVRISPTVVNNLGVRTEPVIQGRLPNNITTVGYVAYDEDQMVHVHPRVEGWIETLFVKAEGEPVEQGKPLYTLYSPTLVNAQEELLLAMNRGNQKLVEAATERLAALNVPASLISRLRQSRDIQRTMTVYAPRSGVIENLNVREGMFIKPGDRVLSIAALDEVWVIGEVFESQLSAVEAGNRVQLTLDYMPGREWRGRVDYVYPEVNPKTRTARVRMRFDNEDGALMPGMFARLEVQGERGKRQFLVPRESVIRTGQSDRLVLALEEGAFKSINVSVGRVGEKHAEILDGLTPGDTVVTSAQFLIDSESSKTSDFQRMSSPQDMDEQGMDHEGMDHSTMSHGGGES
ncbi:MULTISPECIES: efflux RND transporter periplasmic adaptor subunit [Marinobacter]|jgi:Cu(I)/Ag(I) efflux system membrane fusion protein|uniref:Cu(I)/Ag(I) efflux system membrane fusion protein n=2 Tax=Marinobacter TaxID=2742 RepID=A0A368UM62_MARNT|nr:MULTISPECIES: efflux RND transporter periplasmic adaptor subunit [Marinobacter]MEE3170438.1 efflux RND transporter periplasmic adaptor subunit [Pseudomonadota bacterium]KAA1173196.1 efflux RND transporter periplasmic adaptor subunit [Marinobacter salinexigens]MBL3827334.1 efflux RND transporter periplasmic adaptor subunit [Marinobacter sp. MC3]MBL3895840.1 efflux RND transporter periplasmic adaptor subunit [Marinobacter sp. MW3]MCC4272734.1 efflux RND transporter periplasmic adaptor subunit